MRETAGDLHMWSSFGSEKLSHPLDRTFAECIHPMYLEKKITYIVNMIQEAN